MRTTLQIWNEHKTTNPSQEKWYSEEEINEKLDWLCFEKGKIDTANLDYIKEQLLG